MLAGLCGFTDLVGDVKLDGCVLFQMKNLSLWSLLAEYNEHLRRGEE